LYCQFDKQYPGDVPPDYDAIWYRATAQPAHAADRCARQIAAFLVVSCAARAAADAQGVGPHFGDYK
jgi:hypothetical protein